MSNSTIGCSEKALVWRVYFPMEVVKQFSSDVITLLPYKKMIGKVRLTRIIQDPLVSVRQRYHCFRLS